MNCVLNKSSFRAVGTSPWEHQGAMGTKQNHERRGNMPWELECPNTINIIRCLKHLIWSVIRLNPGPDFDSTNKSADLPFLTVIRLADSSGQSAFPPVRGWQHSLLTDDEDWDDYSQSPNVIHKSANPPLVADVGVVHVYTTLAAQGNRLTEPPFSRWVAGSSYTAGRHPSQAQQGPFLIEKNQKYVFICRSENIGFR